jgi:hypothetical protein
LLLGTWLLSTSSLTSCKRPEPVLVPVGEVEVVRRLENGNWEVKPGLILRLFDLKWENKILKARIRELEKK